MWQDKRGHTGKGEKRERIRAKRRQRAAGYSHQSHFLRPYAFQSSHFEESHVIVFTYGITQPFFRSVKNQRAFWYTHSKRFWLVDFHRMRGLSDVYSLVRKRQMVMICHNIRSLSLLCYYISEKHSSHQSTPECWLALSRVAPPPAPLQPTTPR